MESNVHVWPYALKPRDGSAAHSGALLRFETPHGFGYSSLHPWTSLGDLPLETQLQGLAQGKSTPLIRAARDFAEHDARARAEGRWLFEDLVIPRSHWHWMPNLSPSRQIEQLHAQKAPCLKLKIRPSLSLQRLTQLRDVLDHEGLEAVLFRLDANASFDFSEADALLSEIRTHRRLHESIEFFEDPCPVTSQHADAWMALDQHGIPLAADFESSAHARVCILKPARHDRHPISDPRSFVVTTYLDHPLGIAQAAWKAALWSQEYPDEARLPGLLTHHVHEPTPFHEKLGVQDSRLTLERGLGFGFDELLQELEWKKLQV